jgi:hypothetical protein
MLAIYMSLRMAVSFIAIRMTPEALNRDRADPEDARWVRATFHCSGDPFRISR